MGQHNVAKPPSRLLVMATILFYLVAALTMVIANKWVLSTTAPPLFFLFAQLIIAVLLFLASHFVGLFTIPFTMNWALCKGLAPMVGINVLGLSFNNYTLKYVDASFYQVARGLVLPFTVLLSYLFLASRPSSRVLLSCAIVTAGFFIGVIWDNYSSSPATPGPSSTFGSLRGIFFGLLSSVTTATSAVIIKRSLDVVNGSTLHLAWYNNLISSIVMMPVFILAGEGPEVRKLLFEEAGNGWTTFLWGTLITGLFGFLICIAGFLSIKVTSPITHMVSSAVRGVVVSLLGVWFFHDVITTGRLSSIVTILGGSIYYTWVKNEEANKKDMEKRVNGEYERVALDEMERGKETAP